MTFPFQARTVASLVEAIENGYSHSEIRTLFLGIGVEQLDPQGPRVNKATRVQKVLESLRSQNDERATRAALELAVEVLRHGDDGDGWSDQPEWWPPLVNALAADGWEYDQAGERLLPTIEGISVSEERGLVEEQLLVRGWDTAATHYRQAVDAFSTGNWESANAQARSFMEALLPQASTDILDGAKRADVIAALQDLNSNKKLLDGEFDFARGLWKLCNTRGPHAGLSDADEASFRLLALTAYARFLLSRLPE